MRFSTHNIIVILLYTALTLIMTWPVMLNLNDHIAGSGGDPWQSLWRFQDKSESLKTAYNTNTLGAFLSEEFLGRSEPRLVNLSVWPYMPLYWLFGQPMAYNIVWILSFVLSGYGMFLLVSLLTGRKKLKIPIDYKITPRSYLAYIAPAFVAGAFYMFLPYKISHSWGHFGAMQTGWLPLIIALFIIFWRKPSAIIAILLSACLVFQAWIEHHYMLWLGVFSLISVAYFKNEIISYIKNLLNKKYYSSLIPAVIIFASFLLIAASYYPTMRMSALKDDPLNLGIEQTIRYSANILSFVTPASFHSLWGDFFDTWLAKDFSGNVSEATHFLGIAPLLFLLFFIRDIPKKARLFWLTVAAVFFVIALGPRLQVGSMVFNFPLPYALIDDWPVFSAVRTVGRASVFIGLSLAVLIGIILTRRSYVISYALLAVLLVEFIFIPMPMESYSMPQAYHRIQDIPGRTILDIPAASDYVFSSRAIYGYHIHGKETVGNTSRRRSRPDDFLIPRSMPGIRQVLFAHTEALEKNRPDFLNQDLVMSLADGLRFFDTGAILVHADYLEPKQVNALRTFLEDVAGLSEREVDGVFIYETSSLLDLNTDGVLAMRLDGWSYVRFESDTGQYLADIADSAQIKLINTDDVSKQVRISTSFTDNSGAGTVRFLEDDVIEFNEGDNDASFTITLPPGKHSLIFTSADLNSVKLKNPRFEVIK